MKTLIYLSSMVIFFSSIDNYKKDSFDEVWYKEGKFINVSKTGKKYITKKFWNDETFKFNGNNSRAFRIMDFDLTIFRNGKWKITGETQTSHVTNDDLGNMNIEVRIWFEDNTSEIINGIFQLRCSNNQFIESNGREDPRIFRDLTSLCRYKIKISGTGKNC